MALMDEFKKEREAMKNRPLKDKIGYIYDYYKWPIIISILVIVFVSNFIYEKVTAKEDVLYGIILNHYQYGTDFSPEYVSAFSNDCLDALGFDNTNYQITLNTGITYLSDTGSSDTFYDPDSYMVLRTLLNAGSVDFVTGDLDTLLELGNKGVFIDLSTVLTSEEYEKYKPYFVYNNESTPVLIDISRNASIHTLYGKPEDTVMVIGLPADMPHTENAICFLEYLLP